MVERPILFSAPMVRAILDGRKTQTRRSVKPQFSSDVTEVSEQPALDPILKCVVSGRSGLFEDGHGMDEVRRCPYGKPGDRLYVKEHAWMYCEKRPNGVTEKGRLRFEYVPLGASPVWHCENHPERPVMDVVHPETGNMWLWRKKLGRFLPKWASRITLEVIAVRVERLNDISEVDAVAEGVEMAPAPAGKNSYKNYLAMEDAAALRWLRTPVLSYCSLWESLNGAGSWSENPWVWVVEFRRVF